MATSEHAESHCIAEIALYQLVNFFPHKTRDSVKSKPKLLWLAGYNPAGRPFNKKQDHTAFPPRWRILPRRQGNISASLWSADCSSYQVIFFSYSLSHSSTFKKGLDTGSGSASASFSTSRFCLTHTILLKMAASGVDNGYSRRSAEIRKPRAIRRGAKEGLQHSIMCECGPN